MEFVLSIKVLYSLYSTLMVLSNKSEKQDRNNRMCMISALINLRHAMNNWKGRD